MVPPMSAEMFSALVTTRLRPLQGIEVEGGKGLQLKLRLHGQDTTAQLDRYYDRYRANPDTLSAVIDQFVEALVNGTNVDRAGNAEFAAISDKLVPRLMTAQQWMNEQRFGTAHCRQIHRRGFGRSGIDYRRGQRNRLCGDCGDSGMGHRIRNGIRGCPPRKFGTYINRYFYNREWGGIGHSTR